MRFDSNAPQAEWQRELVWGVSGETKVDGDDAWRRGMAVYRESYRARLITVLSETVLMRLSQHWGRPSVAALLSHFFSEHPPTHPMITQSVASLATYVNECPEDYPAWLAPFCELCLEQWRLLHGPDSPPCVESELRAASPQVIRMVPWASLVMGTGQTDSLFARWVGDADPEQGEAGDGVLLVKRGRTQVTSLAVSPPFELMVRDLVAGESLFDALDACFGVRMHDITMFVALLASRGCLTCAAR